MTKETASHSLTGDGWTTDNLNKLTENPTTHDKAADPTKLANTSNMSGTVEPKGTPLFFAFKLLPEERSKIARTVFDYKCGVQSLDLTIDAIEAIINEGWQQC